MIRFLLICLISIALVAPPTADAMGIMKNLWDALTNQLGLDRGGVPKVKPRCGYTDNPKYESRLPRHLYQPVMHIQADGF